MTQKVPQQVLAYDLGGTKVAVGIVDPKGRILDEIRVPTIIQAGKAAVLNQLADVGNVLLKRYPKASRVGLASAGPLDPEKGLLMDPTNFVSAEGSWGNVPISRILSKKLRLPVYLENDAAAAVLAEHWIGAAKGKKNVMILTLGTGLGTGVIINGKLVRGGRNLHTEGGHMIINDSDKTAVCGCGNIGCAEAYLSGNGFTRRARLIMNNIDVSAKDVAEMARKRNKKALLAFSEYAWHMAVTINNYVMMYAPEVIVLTGSFAATHDLFLKQTQKHLEELLIRRRKGVDMMPKIVLSKLENQAGLLGGAYVAYHPEF